MKSNKLLILACAASAALAITGCHRDEADEADHAAVVAPALTPAPATSVAPEAVVASTAPVADSGLPFDTMDSNHDGYITPDELHDNEMLKQHFTQADVNGDGKLAPDEVIKHRADMAAKPGG